MNLSRRRLLQNSATFSAGVTLPLAPAMAGVETLNFVLIGDWGRWGQDNQVDVANQMGIAAAVTGSRFTISLGDNFYENGVTSVHDPQWDGSFEKIYTAPALQSPWKIILGNHDYRGNVQAQIDYSKQSKRWQLPARYYMLSETLPDGGKADFFYLDTSPFMPYYLGTKTNIMGQNPLAQLAWLDKALGNSTANWKIVIGHHPVYTALAPEGTKYDHDQPTLIAMLDPVLRAHNVPIYINGHDHCMQSVMVNGINYVTNGVGSLTYQPGNAIRGGFVSGAHGFMTVALSSEKLDYALVDMTGKTLYGKTLINT